MKVETKSKGNGAAQSSRVILTSGGVGILLLLGLWFLLTPAGQTGQAAAPVELDPEAATIQRNVSVIESIFGAEPDDGVTTVFELDSEEIEEAPHPDNPVNPHTQEPYSNRAMAGFEELRSYFPDNRMIPRRMSPEEVKAYETREQELARKYYVERRVKILTGGLSKAEVDEYFGYRTRFTLDKIELFRYALDNLGEPQNTEARERRARLEQLLASNEGKIERVLQQKEAAYKKNGVAYTLGEIYLAE